ncbi:MAG: ABC transporter substrate-binding protein, partial [Vallitaleaceae bacterium]|nr:ABC transporter substrate-binding protein [Vallitaleaceae bacterium]
MKKIVSLILVLLLTTAMFAGCKKDEEVSGSGSGEPIKIGMLTPLSGDLAQYGQAVLNAAQLAIKAVNDKGGVNGSQVELVYYDNEADQTKSLNLFNRLVDQDKIVALIGPVISGTSLVVAPEANSKKIPMITPTGTNTDITVGYDYVFRACYIDPYQGKMVAKFANEKLGAKSAVIFRNVSSDYSTGLADAFIAGFNGEVVADEGYTQEDSDFNAIITKIKDLNPDVIFIPDYFNKVGLVAKQLKEAGVT